MMRFEPSPLGKAINKQFVGKWVLTGLSAGTIGIILSEWLVYLIAGKWTGRWLLVKGALQTGIFLTVFSGLLLPLLPRLINRLRYTEESELKYRALFQHANDGMLLFGIDDSQPRVVDVNDTCCEMLGYSRHEMFHVFLSRLIETDREFLMTVRNVLLGEGQISFERLVDKKGSTKIPVEVNARRLDLAGMQMALCVVRDISERKRSEETIRQLAYYDRITGLPNMSLYHDRFAEAASAADRQLHQMAILVVQVNRLQMIVDTMGRQFANETLRQISKRIRPTLDHKDLLTRSEDVFIALLPSVSGAGEAVKAIDRIVEGLEVPLHIGADELHISSAAGIALYPQDGRQLEELIRSGKFAMYKAREFGSKYEMYDPAMNQIPDNSLQIETDLHKALALEQFELYYQPQICLKTGELIGAEALIRWNHPDWGFVSPAEFIPLAEESGLIIPIGEWVMREACRQNKLWQEAGMKPMPVSVNLSVRQFMQHDLTETIRSILQDTDMHPRFLELEITETLAMKADWSISVLKDLKGLGVQISIDDFGTGYSSLMYLKRFPIDKLKIDQSFVGDMLDTNQGGGIVSTIISMARHMNLKVIAEGVEYQEQMDYLKQQHCDEIQGYLISPPLNAKSFERFVQNYGCRYDVKPVIG